MNKKRLLKLADFLETIPRKSFDITSWVTSAPTKPEGRVPGECGFAGCAVGWAAHAQLFPELRIGGNSAWTDLTYKGRPCLGSHAAMATFGIDQRGLRTLFIAAAYRSGNPAPHTVARRIRAFVKTNGAVS